MVTNYDHGFFYLSKKTALNSLKNAIVVSIVLLNGRLIESYSTIVQKLCQGSKPVVIAAKLCNYIIT